MVALKTNSFTITVVAKTGNLAATGGGKIGLKVPHKALFLENCNYYLSCLAAFWTFPHAELDFIWPDSRLTQCEQSFPSGIKKESLVKESSGDRRGMSWLLVQYCFLEMWPRASFLTPTKFLLCPKLHFGSFSAKQKLPKSASNITTLKLTYWVERDTGLWWRIFCTFKS